MTALSVNLKAMSLMRRPGPGAEPAAALIGTAVCATLLVLTALYAGPLWRDETNTLNLAQMPSLKEFWNNLTFESFPPLWPLLVRVWGFLGMVGSDESIRILGLYVGLFFLASLWLCSRWMGGRAPILSIALLGCLPAFIFIVGANRAYGLASCLLVLSFGMIWRVVEHPSRSRLLWAGFVCLLFAHCVYYDALFLGAMLSGAAAVVIRRRQWKTLGALAGIGAVSGASLVIYLPVIRRGSAYLPMIQEPSFNFATLWRKLGEAVAARGSVQPGGPNAPEVWLWIALLLAGAIVAVVAQRAGKHRTQNQEAANASIVRVRADLALFCVVSMVLGTLGYLAFLLKLHYLTQTWYYIEMLCLCAVSLDGILGANWPGLRPWGLLRIGFMVVMMTWCAKAAWVEAHTRRSNVDLIADVLGKDAAEGDLIVVDTVWEGITFNRYYQGRAHWVTVPPIDSHEVHRNDLVKEKLNQPETMAPVLREITSTLRGGNSVWLVGHPNVVYPRPLPPLPRPPAQWWFGSYFAYWSAQVTTHLLNQARHEQVLVIPMDGPVSGLENLPVIRFSGCKSDAD
jgi:hypothetical protein